MPKLAPLDWQTVDTSTMPANLKRAYDQYRKTVDATNKEREALEKAVTAHLTSKKLIPTGLVPRFAYRWGKMAIAFAEPGETATQGGGKAFTF